MSKPALSGWSLVMNGLGWLSMIGGCGGGMGWLIFSGAKLMAAYTFVGGMVAGLIFMAFSALLASVDRL
mgnify:CR=1 FL=1